MCRAATVSRKGLCETCAVNSEMRMRRLMERDDPIPAGVVAAVTPGRTSSLVAEHQHPPCIQCCPCAVCRVLREMIWVGPSND